MLVAFAGPSGAGKTTAIEHLERQGLGIRYYAGIILVDEITKRGLDRTPDNERRIRNEMRAEHGMAVFAEKALPTLLERCATETVFLDAIYCPEERECYSEAFGNRLAVIAITAEFAVRAARVSERPDRSLPRCKLQARDELEYGKFRLGDVISNATRTIENNGTLDEFKEALNMLSGTLL